MRAARARRCGSGAVSSNVSSAQADGGPMLQAGRIVPTYGLTRGVSARTLRTAIRAGLDRYGPYPEYLPASMVGAQPGIRAAMETAHFPDDFETRDDALLRLG